ncbi:hypothetical protein BCV69DRAFT_279657 [Microstroma glucosiphilum]|uniref:SH3 domain-containing protein n=1 Tax=Pseudomicrostroma glucosiphilum TaxID=1684307 RepID=A0A316UHB2_9BASI|nr:hypothetical protein BCV69DRAFT_279657 [Pseudomicrostroma glucosiphilum]PWN23731.1 hypothetical protein BCV69DRAFT_279657 [Pseudomicrostroma glucosiphilum]
MASVPSTSSHSTPTSLASKAERLSISQDKHAPLSEAKSEQHTSPTEGTASASDASSSTHTGSDESSAASQQTDATNMLSDAHIEAAPGEASSATASEQKNQNQSRRSSEGGPLLPAPETAGQMEEYPTPSGALLPPPEGERSVLAALSGSTLKVRRGSIEVGEGSATRDAEEVSHSAPVHPGGSKTVNAAGGPTSAAVGTFKADDPAGTEASSDSTQPPTALSSGEQSQQSVASGSLLQRSEQGRSTDTMCRSSSSAGEASSANSRRPHSPRHRGHESQGSASSHLFEEEQHTLAPSSDVRPASFEGAAFVPIKVKDFAFPEADPRHVGARDVSLGAPTSKGHPFIHRKPREEDWDESDADSSGVSLGNQGRWRGGAGDDWGPGVSYDEDEEEFEGDHGRRGSGGSGQEQYDAEVEEGEPGTQPGLYEVIYDFGAESEHELSVSTGDRVRVVASVDGGWAVGIREGDGKEGLVPEGYLVWVSA